MLSLKCINVLFCLATADITLLQTYPATAARTVFHQQIHIVSKSKFLLGGDYYLLLSAVLSNAFACRE